MGTLLAMTPGELLLQALTKQHMTQADLARRTGYSTKHINQVALGKKGVSVDFAVRAGLVLGEDIVWPLLKAQVEIDVAEARARVMWRWPTPPGVTMKSTLDRS